MSQAIQTGGHATGLASTVRTDAWWVGPLLTFLGLSAFGLYSTWAAFQGAHYWHGSYLSPFYSPVFFVDLMAAGAAPMEHAWFGEWPSWWPSFVPASPALLILVFPLSFRATCYYYRKAYYRAFFAAPLGCAVGSLPQKNYKGETFLLLIQNLHRYALYFALCFIVVLYYDAFMSFYRDGEFGVGVGCIVLLLNATFLGLYTTGCHSFRHLMGGRLNHFACVGGQDVAKGAKEGTPSVRYSIWKRISKLNCKHMLSAWVSLFWVGFSDLYVRLCSMGVITDLNTWDLFSK